MKTILHYVILFILFILQTTLSKYVSFFGVFPNLILVYSICLCLIFTDLKSIVLATVAGLLLDFHGGMTIGYNALFYMYFGIATVFFGDNFFRGKRVVTLLYTAVSTVVYELLYYVLFFAIWSRGGSFGNVTYIIIMEALINVLCVLPIYAVVKKTDISGFRLRQ